LADRDAEFIAETLALACENARSGKGGPFGAIVVHDGKIVGHGANEVTASNDPTAHAEIVAIRQAGRALGRFDLSGAVLYSSCEPCPMCLTAAYWARVDRVVFAATQEEAAAAGFDDAFFYQEVAKPYHARSLQMVRITADGENPFEVWLANPDRIPY
jgi:guanine deaminase